MPWQPDVPQQGWATNLHENLFHKRSTRDALYALLSQLVDGCLATYKRLRCYTAWRMCRTSYPAVADRTATTSN